MSYFHAINGQGGSPTPSQDHPPVLLWSNPNPSTGFEGQTLALDLTNYEGVLIKFRGSTVEDFFTRVYLKKTDSGNNMGAGSYSATGGYSYGRHITLSDSGITFATTYRGDTAGNDVCVPVEVYGVKGYVVEPTVGTTLWTNPNNRTNFTAQTIDLELEDFDAIELAFTFSAERAIVERRVIIPIGGLTFVGEGSDTNMNIRRVAVSSTGVTFGNGGYASGSAFANGGGFIIPLSIKGVKYN